jgi:hypothetical protein
MHARCEVPTALIQLADLQAGLVTREQVLGHGLSRHVIRRLVDGGMWLRVCPGLFAVVPIAPSWEALAWGGTLLGGCSSRLGPEASGYLYGLVARPPRSIDVLVPLSSPKQAQGPWRFIREAPGRRPARSPGSPPRLPAECAVLDLVAQRSEGEVVGLITSAVQKGLTTPSRLSRLLDERPRQRYRRLVAGLLADVDEGVRSYLELRYLRDVERAHRLPRGDRQDSRPDLPYLRDVKYKKFGVIVELDGRTGHEGEGRFRDMNRDNQHALRDELTLRYGYFDVTSRACPVAFQVHGALSRRGLDEPFQRCAHCLGVPEGHLASG